jgi:hypothetical protein
MATMEDEDGRFTNARTHSVSIHRVTAEDIGKSCGGLLYTYPDDTRNMVNSRGQIVLRLGGEGNIVYLNDVEAAEELVTYLTAAIHDFHLASIHKSDNQ